MPRHVPRPKSIDDWGGLKPYLNGTAEQHNGLGYRDFLTRINPKRKHPIPKPVMAEDFGVSTKTFYSWLKRHEAEQAPTSPPGEA